MTTSSSSSHLSEYVTNRQGKFLLFQIEEEEFGIEILKVKEIIGGMMELTRIPRTPEFVQGVINLRGKVIPILDLRAKFGFSFEDYNDRTCIIVVEVHGEEGVVLIGIAVDSVAEVLNISSEVISPSPSFGSTLDTSYILGLAKIKGQVKTLIDIDKIIASEELVLLSSL